jgi:hypothetical protein
MGAGAMLHVASKNSNLGKLISIAAPSDFKHILNEFCTTLSVGKKCRNLFLNNVEKEVKFSHSELKIDAHMSQVSSPMLLIHDEEDKVLSYTNALQLNNSCINTKLISTRGLGHSRILKSEYVVEKILEFIKK